MWQCKVYTCFCEVWVRWSSGGKPASCSEYGGPAFGGCMESGETGDWPVAGGGCVSADLPHTGHGHNKWTGAMAAQNWVMIISEQHRYQGVSYKSDIIVISGDLDTEHEETLQCASVHLQGWMLGTDRPWSSSTPGASRPASWTARTGGLCWRVWTTTRWTWWTCWCPGGGTGWRASPSRERCPVSTTKMTCGRWKTLTIWGPPPLGSRRSWLKVWYARTVTSVIIIRSRFLFLRGQCGHVCKLDILGLQLSITCPKMFQGIEQTLPWLVGKKVFHLQAKHLIQKFNVQERFKSVLKFSSRKHSKKLQCRSKHEKESSKCWTSD